MVKLKNPDDNISNGIVTDVSIDPKANSSNSTTEIESKRFVYFFLNKILYCYFNPSQSK